MLDPQASVLGLATNQWVPKDVLVQKCLEYADLEKKRLSFLREKEKLTAERCAPIVYAQLAADFVRFFFAMEAMFYTQEWDAPTQSLGFFLQEARLPEPDHKALTQQVRMLPCPCQHNHLAAAVVDA